MEETRSRFAASTEVNADGEFEILAISAGQGNGWQFKPEVLRESLPLWDGSECFIDHDLWGHRSVRDLGGVTYQPAWDDSRQGIRMRLRAVGPAGPLVAELGRAMLAGNGPKPDVGFSADILFTAVNKEVEQILRVYSVDLVFEPARGGEFIRQLYQRIRTTKNTKDTMILSERQEEIKMNEQEVVRDETQAEGAMSRKDGTLSHKDGTMQSELDALNKIKAHAAALASAPGEKGPAADTVKAELEAMRQVRLQACGLLLDTALEASKLPGPLVESIRGRFATRLFEPEDLNKAIEEGRKLVSALTGGAAVQGPGRINGMYDTRDQLQAATDDLLGAKRDPELASLKVQKLQGIRELYMMLTGDHDLHGGYHPERVRLATTADFAGLVKNALNKLIVSDWEALGKAGYDWWEDIVTVQHFNSLNSITGVIVGTVGDLPTVAEGGEYTELPVGDSAETASFTKYGGYIPLTLELIDRDETQKLRAYAREMANAGLRKISKLVAAIFTDNSGVGPTMADTGTLFNSNAVTTAGGHKNLLTTALAAAEWEVVSAAVYNQPVLIKNAASYYGTGPKMAINPRYCLVPRALQLAARNIFLADWAVVQNYHYDNLLKGAALPITVPEWTDATDWAAVCDPQIAPAIFVGERFGLMPEVFISGDEQSPAVFTNDESRLKVRHFLAVWVNDYRPLHKSNVA